MGLMFVVVGILGFLSLRGTQAAGLVKLDVYYEALCPDSNDFFHQHLAPTYEKLSSHLSVELIPYGNAYYRGQHDNYSFNCQHGPEECYGNMVQTCYIELCNNTESQIKFVNCAFDVRYQRKVMESCIDDLDLRRQVKKCVTSPMGMNLEYEMAKRTDALNPSHTFIPWITVDGVGSNRINNRATENLMSVVCDKLSDPKPNACMRNQWNIWNTFRGNYL